jgi:hypothetical protein
MGSLIDFGNVEYIYIIIILFFVKKLLIMSFEFSNTLPNPPYALGVSI